MKKFILTINILIFFSSYGQELNTPYYLISNDYEDTVYKMHELIFKNDSTVIEIFKTDSGSIKTQYSYKAKDKSLTIFNFRFKENVTYKIENNELWNLDRKQIYLTNDKLENKKSFIMVVEGDIWNGDIYQSNKKRERQFRKFLKARIDNRKKMRIVVLKGFDAFMKFGAYKSAIEYTNE